MGSRRGQLVLVGVVGAAAIAASGAWGSSLRVLMSHTPNKTESNRTMKTISGIVIHDTEGRFIGSIRTLQNPHVDGSAHFVVSRRGQVVQLVPVTDVAWHSGNTWWNLHSIGIEHEGWADKQSYTEVEYRASAQLVAYLAHRWGVPLDREHIIGHAEVPDPNHPGRFGGSSHHYDPGPNWKWRHYMSLVHYYAAHPVLPHFVRSMVLHSSPVPHTRVITRTVVHATPVQVTAPVTRLVTRSTIDRHATVHGKALWWSGIDESRRWQRHIWKVDFIVDGKTLYTDHTWPYSFHRTQGWDSRSATNGSHMLSVLAYGTHHYRVRKSIPIRVANAPLHARVTGAVSGGAVSGLVKLGVRLNGTVERVTLYADGTPVSRDATVPFTLSWNTSQVAEGSHVLLVYARDARGHRTALRIPVVVANAPGYPAALARNWVTHHVETSGFSTFSAAGE
jgi:N-acetyl-anhydromuramyl-L-alanine amidase AmpD